MPAPPPTGSSTSEQPQKWGDRPPISGRQYNTLWLPNQGRYVYFNDAPQAISQAEANGIRRIANQFGVTLQGIAPGTPRIVGPYVVPRSRVPFSSLLSGGTTYSPGVGEIVGANAQLNREQNTPAPEDARGYWDEELGWVPLGTDPSTGEPFAPEGGAPSTGGSPGGTAEPTSAPTAIGPDGQILSPNANVAQLKYDTAVANARNDILRERARRGVTSPLTPLEDRAISAEAARRAVESTRAYIGGVDTNSPFYNPLAADSVAEFKEGQFLPEFTGYQDIRRLTNDEVANLNWLKVAASEDDSINSVYDLLLDPYVPADQKASVLGQVTGIRAQEERAAAAVQDQNSVLSIIGSAWNPLTWGPRLAFKALDLITPVYTDYVDPSATWVVTALPGGMRTASWNEAQSIPVGQAVSQVAGPLAPFISPFNRAGSYFAQGQYLAAGAEALGIFTGQSFVNAAAQTGLSLGEGADLGQALTGAAYGGTVDGNFDLALATPWTVQADPNKIYDANYRKSAFEVNKYGSATSGAIGFSSSLIWDPLNVIGPTGKIIRVSHRLGMGAGMLRGSAKDLARFKSHLDAGQVKYLGYDEARKALEEARLTGDEEVIARAYEAFKTARTVKNKEVRGWARGTNTLTKFGDWILDPRTGRARTVTEILRHSVVRGMPNAAEFAQALTKVRTFEEYSLIMRAQAGDAKAQSLLRLKNQELAEEIAYLQTTRSADNAATAPEDFAKARAARRTETTAALAEFNRLREANPIDAVAFMDSGASAQKLANAIDVIRAGDGLGIDAAARDRLWAEADKASELLEEAVFGASYARWDERTRKAYRDLYAAIQREKALDYAETGRGLIDDAEKARIDTRLAQLQRENQAYELAMNSEMGLVQNRVNFGLGNAQGLAKWREAARQVRAERQSRQAASHGSGFKWVRNTFDVGNVSADGKLTVWGAVRGTRNVVADAVTRPFTYAAMESPAGYIRVKGIEAGSSYREILAILNNLKFYSSPEMQARKNYILDRYTRMLNSPRHTGLEAVEAVEKSIITDMASAMMRKHGIDSDPKAVQRVVEELRDVYAMYDSRRSELVSSIKNNTYWKDEAGNLHSSPVIESQLVDSIPMLDFRRMERLADNFVGDLAKYGLNRVDTVKTTRSLQPYQDAVVRAAERSDVATAEAAAAERQLADLQVLPYDASSARAAARAGDATAQKYLDDLRDAGALRAKTKKTQKQLQSALDDAITNRDKAIAAPTPGQQAKEGFLSTYDYFESLWRASVLLRVGYPVRNTVDGLARRFAFEASVLPMLEDAVSGVRNSVLNVAEGSNVPLPSGRLRDAVKNRNAAKALEQMEKSGKLPRRVARWTSREVARLSAFRDNQRKIGDYAMEALHRLRAERSSVLPHERAQFDAALYEIERNVRLINTSVMDVNRKIRALQNGTPSSIIANYRRSLDRPRRVGQEMVQGVDGRTYWGARSDPNFADILEANASAGETVQATLGLNLNISRSMMKASQFASGGVVKFGDPNYYSALTQVINNQVRNSLPGRMWLSGASLEEVANALMDPQSGAKYRSMLLNDDSKARKAKAAQRKQDADYDRRAAQAVEDQIEMETGFNPKDIARLESDADRSHALLGSIDVPGIGRIDTIAELVDVGGKRTVHIRLKAPAVADADYVPNEAGYRFIEWEIAPAGEQMPSLLRYPRGDTVPGGESLRGAAGNETVPRVTLKRSDVTRGTGQESYSGSAYEFTDADGNKVYFRGTVLEKEALPENVWHVTVNDPAVAKDGMIRVSGSEGAEGGLGGGDRAMKAVSFTTDESVADQIAADLMFHLAGRNLAASGYATARQLRKVIADEFWFEAKYYKETTGAYPMTRAKLQAKLDEILRLIPDDARGSEAAWDAASDMYFSVRQTVFEVENPIILNKKSQDLVDPADVMIYQLDTKSIPDEALILDNGHLGKTGEHKEVQIFADIPISPQAKIKTPAIYGTRRAGYLPPTPAARPAARAATALNAADDPRIVQAVVDAIKGQGYGVRVSVLQDGRTVSVTLPEVTDDIRAEVIDRAVLRAREIEQGKSSVFDEFSDGVDMIHSMYRIDTYDDALLHAQWLFDEFARYIPDETLRQMLASGPVREAQVIALFDDAGKRADLPAEIHGAEMTTATGKADSRVGRLVTGLQGFTDKALQSGFRKLGTIPEDRLVRLPFMARRYQETLEAGSRVLADAYPDGDVPAWAVDWIIQAARKRAVKDTNDIFYSQPRRTNFARVMERYIPFIGAWQNSVMAMSKLVATNPETLILFERAWRAPDQLGVTDQDGNLRIPIPSWLAGRSVWVPVLGEIPLTGVYGDEWVYDKKSAMVIPQQFDPVLSFKSGPVFQMTTSMIFQAGWLGPVPPRALEIALDNILGEGSAQSVWNAAVIGTFGIDEFGRDEGYARAAAISGQPLGYDKALPPVGQKIASVVQASFGNNPSNSRAYAVAYMNIARDETLKWMRGERDVPSRDEIRDRTNGLFTVRGLTNLIGVSGGPLGGLTPPQADYEGAEIVQLYRQIQDLYGYEQADEVFVSLFGDEALGLVKTNSSRGVSPATTKSLAISEKYQSLIGTIAPRVQDAGLLTWALSDGTETQADYSPNVLMTQFFRDVPGTAEQQRDPISPEQSFIDANVSRGWVTWIQFKQAQQAELDARGLGSINSNGAEDILADRRNFLNNAANDPLYRDWYAAYNDGFSDNLLAARDFIRSFTGNEEWMSDRAAGANPTGMWNAALEWQEEREKYFDAFQRAGDNDTARRAVRDQWLVRATEIARSNPRFYDFWIRYLDADDLTVK